MEKERDAEIAVRIGEAQNAFRNLNKVWKTQKLLMATKFEFSVQR